MNKKATAGIICPCSEKTAKMEGKKHAKRIR